MSWGTPKRNIQITGNSFSIQNRVPSGASDGIILKNGATSSATIDRNTITFDSSGPGSSAFWGIGGEDVSNTTVSNNVVGLASTAVDNGFALSSVVMFNNRTPAGALIPSLNNQ
jgi:hypothetical protein